AAGMVTTREFLQMAAWHLFDRPALRERCLAAPGPERQAILLEVLRLEPVVAHLFRRAAQDLDLTDDAGVRPADRVGGDHRRLRREGPPPAAGLTPLPPPVPLRRTDSAPLTCTPVQVC
ncbi:MAG: hypothetical protein Q4D18_05300, partial [Micrococcus sp.]|nr:hypothetical protein [Micrococcus sp.]